MSAASSMMSWRLEQRGGRDSLDVLFEGRPLLDAIESSLAVLVIFTVAVALASWLRHATLVHPPPPGVFRPGLSIRPELAPRQPSHAVAADHQRVVVVGE